MVSCCASHSAAIASAIWRVGATTARPDGVRIGLPSSVMANPLRPFSNGGIGVEPLALRRARGAPHRLLRIERGFSGNFVEQFTHAVS